MGLAILEFRIKKWIVYDHRKGMAMGIVNKLVKGLAGLYIGGMSSVGILIIIESVVFDVTRIPDIDDMLLRTVEIGGLIAGIFLYKATWVQIFALVGGFLLIFILFVAFGPHLIWK